MKKENKKLKTLSSDAKTQSALDMKKYLQKTGKAQTESLSMKEVEIKFIVLGSSTSKVGNATPKLKMTGRQFWLPKAREYTQWKQKVVSSLLDQTRSHPARYMMQRNLVLKGKPLGTAKDLYGRMDLRIFWKDDKHGDPENIFGALADSLFFQDKYLDGSFEAKRSESGEGLVEVSILLKQL